jgi:hypothetical protein
MKTDTDTIFKYIFWGVAAVVTVLFIVIGIIQKEFILSLLWAALVSGICWVLLIIIKKLTLYAVSKVGIRKPPLNDAS